MGVIIDFLSGIGQAISAIFQFIVDLVQDLIWFIAFLVELIPAIPALFTWLPAGLVTTLVVGISVVVILRVIGRSE